MTALNRFLTGASKAVDFAVQKLVTVLILALVVVITLQIIMREFFTALSWSDEISRFLLIYLSMLGASLAYNRGSHISIRLFHDRLPERAARAADIVIHVLSLAFFVLLIQYSGILIARQRFQVSGALRIPMQYIYVSIPISVSIMSLFSIAKIAENLNCLFGGRVKQ